jgi:hypothetical protein
MQPPKPTQLPPDPAAAYTRFGHFSGFRFDRVQLKKGAYSPIGHGELEFEQQQLRKRTIEILSGDKSLKMDVTGFPINEDILKSQLELQAKLAAALEGRGRLAVEVISEHAQQGTAADAEPATRDRRG